MQKKGLTVKGGGAIIINVVARTANASELRETTTRSLKTIQRRKKSFDEQISQILKELNALRNWKKFGGFGELLNGNGKLRIRIEHKSLILAQDERWRRA